MPFKACRRYLPAVDANEPGDLNKGIERNTRRQGRRLIIERHVKKPFKIGHKKSRILIIEKRQKIEQKRKKEQRTPRQSAFFFWLSKGCGKDIVHAKGCKKQKQSLGIPGHIEDNGKKQKKQAAAPWPANSGQPGAKNKKRKEKKEEG